MSAPKAVHRPQAARTLEPSESANSGNELSITLTLTARQLDALADAVATCLQPAAPVGLVDARTVAAALGVSADTVRTHAERLGGQRIGDGTRGRWRFDLDAAVAAWTHRPVAGVSLDSKPPTPRATLRRRRTGGKGSGPRLLPIHGFDGAPSNGKGPP